MNKHHLGIVLFVTTSTVAFAQSRRGPFHAATLAFPAETSIVATGDFNADGAVDAIGWYFVDTNRDHAIIRIYHNDGTGEFVESSVQSPISYHDQFTWDIEVGKVDATPGDDWVAGFDTTVRVSTGVEWTEPARIQEIALFDPDGDGDDDLAVLGTELRYYQNDSGSYALTSTIAASQIAELHVGDFDGVPGVDLVLVDPYRAKPVSVRNGTLVAAPLLMFAVPPVGAMFAAGDIDSDGDDDIVAFSPEGRFGAPASYQVIRRTGSTSFQAEPAAFGGPATGLSDVDGDGDLDGVCCGGGGGPFPTYNTMGSTFHVSINDGTGAFAPAWKLRGLGAFRLAGHEDCDGDGNPDLIAGRAILFDRGGFGSEPQPAGEQEFRFPIADFDDDGDLDWDVKFGRRMENQGTGAAMLTTSTPPPISAGWLTGRPIVGDFDGDGDNDMICRNATGFTSQQARLHGMRLLLQAGAGHYVDGGLAAPQGSNFLGDSGWNEQGRRRELVADIDADGDLDVLVGFSTLLAWINDGSGSFTKRESPAVYPAGEVRAVVDLDGDGHLDVVTTRGYFFNDGTQSFAPGAFFQPTSTTHDADVSDFDGDSRPDIVFRSYYQRNISVLWNQGGGSFQRVDYHEPLPLDRRAMTVKSIDADDDGHGDVMIGTSNDSTLIMFGDGNRGFPEHVMQLFDSGRLLDVDGDGDLDVLSSTITRNQRFASPVDGMCRQYGHGTVGSGGIVPKLGATGPYRENELVGFRIVGAPGGAPVLLVVGLGEVSWPDFPLPGLHGFVSPAATMPLFARGAAGDMGQGSIKFGLPVVPGLGGHDVYHQAFVLDAGAPGGVSQTAGLMIGYR